MEKKFRKIIITTKEITEEELQDFEDDIVELKEIGFVTNIFRMKT